AGTARERALRGPGRLRGPLRAGLGRGRRAGGLPGGRRRRGALEAHRSADRGDRGHPPAAGTGTGGARQVSPAARYLRLLLAAVLALALAHAPPALAQAVGDPAPLAFTDAAEESRFHALTSELRCVMCQNQSLADSNAQIAHDMRREVLALMRQGRSDAEIKQHLVQRYGEFVLYRPT